MSDDKLSFIENELKKFNVTDAAIFELTNKYMPLAINGIDDKEGLKVVKEARSIIKRYRIDVDKRRKELNSDALEYQRRINGEAKRITALLEPIESHLANQEKKIDDEIERIKLEKEEQEATRYQERVAKLVKLRFMFDGVYYYSPYLDTFNNETMKISVLLLKQSSDDTFNDFYENAKHYFQFEERAEAEKKASEEADRIALEEERARLESIAKEQAEKDAELKAEAERIENLKGNKASELSEAPFVESNQNNFSFGRSPHSPVKRDVFIDFGYISYVYDQLTDDEINKVLSFVENRIDHAIKRCIAESVHDMKKNSESEQALKKFQERLKNNIK